MAPSSYSSILLHPLMLRPAASQLMMCNMSTFGSDNLPLLSCMRTTSLRRQLQLLLLILLLRHELTKVEGQCVLA